MNFNDLVFEMCDQHGLKAISSATDIDSSALSRFRSGQCGLTVSQIGKIIDFGGLIMLRKEQYNDLISSLKTAYRLVPAPSLKK